MFCQRESQGVLTQCHDHAVSHKDDDTENEDEEGWGCPRPRVPSHHWSWDEVDIWWGRAGSGRAHGQADWDLGCQFGAAKGSTMGIPNWVLRGSRNPNSRDQVNLPLRESWQMSGRSKASGPTGSEYVHSFNNIGQGAPTRQPLF